MACEFALKTAGPAAQVKLLPDVTELRADGKDICHLEFQVADAEGVRVPDAQNELSFEVDGPAVILGIENADLNSFTNFKDSVHKALNGRGLAILQSTRIGGTITVKVTSTGLKPATLTLSSGL